MYKEVIVNVQTNEVIERDLSDEMISEIRANEAKAEEENLAEKNAASIKSEAKASRDAKLATMGFTAAEIENW